MCMKAAAVFIHTWASCTLPLVVLGTDSNCKMNKMANQRLSKTNVRNIVMVYE